MKHIFITGIGTEVGKTVASAIVTEALQADYFKPIQAGDLENSDTHKVERLVSNSVTKFHPNAFALKTPMSPHAAAEIDQVQIKHKKNCVFLSVFVSVWLQSNKIDSPHGLLMDLQRCRY